jgi:hypothetical protein
MPLQQQNEVSLVTAADTFSAAGRIKIITQTAWRRPDEKAGLA